MDRDKWNKNLFHELSQSPIVCALANRKYEQRHGDEIYDEKIESFEHQMRRYDTKLSSRRNEFVFNLPVNCGCCKCTDIGFLENFYICTLSTSADNIIDLKITPLYIIYEEEERKPDTARPNSELENRTGNSEIISSKLPMVLPSEMTEPTMTIKCDYLPIWIGIAIEKKPSERALNFRKRIFNFLFLANRMEPESFGWIFNFRIQSITRNWKKRRRKHRADTLSQPLKSLMNLRYLIFGQETIC